MSVIMYSKKPLSFGLCLVRKPTFYICKNKGTDQLRDDNSLNQRAFVSQHIEQALHFLNLEFQASSHLLWLRSPVFVGNPEERFSRDKVLFSSTGKQLCITQKPTFSRKNRKPEDQWSCKRSPVSWAYCKYKKVLPNFALI